MAKASVLLGQVVRVLEKWEQRGLAANAAPPESRPLERDHQAALMSAISEGILTIDRQGDPLFYNSRFAMIIGERDLAGRKLWKMGLDLEVLNAFQAALNEGRSVTVQAVPFGTETGRQFYSVSASPLRDGSGAIYGALGVFHDVTELKRAEQIRIDFVANVSHELRTPLTAIKGYADTLIEDAESGRPVEKEFIRIIARNSERLMELIHDLLDLSAIESSDVLQKEPVATEEITRRVIAGLQGAWRPKAQEIRVRCEAAAVIADPRRLEQVLVNLLDNACKYAPAGGRIDVSWVTESAAVALRVADDGPGIPAEAQSRVFERFYRVDRARSRDVGGTGLGLAIVKHIVQRHGGSVDLESAAGKGATFICRFPAR